MNLLSIIIIFLAIAAAGGIIYAAWELSADEPRRPVNSDRDDGGSGPAETSGKDEPRP